MRKKKLFTPSTIVPPPDVSSSDGIHAHISSSERRIAAEKLSLARAQAARERAQWEAVVTQREKEILDLRRQLDEARERAEKERREYQSMIAVHTDHLQAAVAEIDDRRLADKTKVAAVMGEVKTMTELVVSAQSKLFAEQEKLHQIRRDYAHRQRQYEDRLHEKDETITELQERMAKKEESFLTEKNALLDEKNRLSAELVSVRAALDGERAAHEHLLTQKNAAIAKLQTGVQDAIVRMNQERREMAELQKKLAAAEQREALMQDQVRHLRLDVNAGSSAPTKAPDSVGR